MRSDTRQRTLAPPVFPKPERLRFLGAFLAAALLILSASLKSKGAELSSETLKTWDGVVNLRRVRSGHDNFGRMGGCRPRFGSGEGRRPGHFVPDPESFAAEPSIISGGEQVASGAKVRGDDSVNLDETLRMPSRFEPSHSPLPLARRLMRVLSPVI